MATEARSDVELALRLRASIIVPVHDRINLTRACLNALGTQDLSDSEIIVVDDGSSAADAAALSAFSTQVRIVRTLSRSGFAGACNAGAAVAEGSYLIFLNNDALPLPGWLLALTRYADDHPQVGIVGARLLWPDGTVQHAGVIMRDGGHPHNLYSGMPGDHPAVCRSRRLRAVTGAAMLIRRDTWDQLGGFDTRFHNSFDDVDLCLRAGKLGYEVHVCGDAVLMHLESASRGQMPARDFENHRKLVERWGVLEPDEISVYVADGLISLRYDDGVRQVVVDPELGTAAPVDDAAVDRLLNRRSREVALLRRENLRLRAQVNDPWRDPVAHVSDAGTVAPTTSIVVWLTGHDSISALLQALDGQTRNPDGLEVVVVNSGCVLAPEDHSELRRARRFRVTMLDVSGGRAAAANRGISQARGDLVILLAGDFIPGPEFVESHLRLHRDDESRELVGIGPVRFPDHLRRDRFARWLEDSGRLFGVPFTRLIGELPPGWFYCANASAKRGFLLESGGFDERFPYEAHDDAEFGLRLAARGMRSGLVPGALAVHEHSLSLRERRDSMRKAGESLAINDSIYPRPHAWHSSLDQSTPPSRAATAAAWLRHIALRREADHSTYYERTLERSRVSAYRRRIRSGL